MPGLPFTAPADLIEYARYATSRPKLYGDLYYCLSSQVKAGKTVGDRTWAQRNADNVAAFKAVWLDIDGYKAEKGYGSLSDALTALKKFCQAAALPVPNALVCSGGGWHAYWISNRSLSEAEWRPYAEGLWALAVKHGLRADAGVTTDSVRVLRVPGTFNHKSSPPKPVKLVALVPADYAFESALGHIRLSQGIIPRSVTRVKNADVCDLTKFTQQAPVEGLETIGLTRDFDLPLAWEPLLEASGCPHVQDAMSTGGASYAQPVWHLDALLTSFLKDGRRLFHRMSNRHKSYDPGDTDRMFDRKVNEREERELGWPSCAALEGAGVTSCKFCPHKGKIRSPLNLTRPAATPSLSKPNVGTSAQVPTSTTPFEPNPLHLPRGYKIDEQGRLCEKIIKFDAAGKPFDKWDVVIANKIWAPYIASHPTTFNFKAITNLNEERDISIPYADLFTKETLGRALYNQDVMVIHGKEEATVKMFKPWVRILQETIEAHRAMPYGWATAVGGKPVGFVYGGTLYSNDGTERPCGKDDEFREIFSPSGEEDAWFKALDLVTLQPRVALEAIVAAAFASPLLYMTGQNGGVIAAVGPTSANKSTSVDLGNAIWGKPILAKAVLGASNKGVIKLLEQLHNLPVYWDDIKQERLQEAVKVISQVTEGQGGVHLKSNREFAANGTWQSILTICANGNIIDELLKNSKTDTAQLYRVFQFSVPEAPDPPDQGQGRVAATIARPLQAQLDYNYGRVGQRYAKWLGSEPEAIRKAVLQKQNDFSIAVGERRAERFWVAVCGTIYTGAMLANQGLGANFHLPELWEFLKESFFKLRERVEGEHLEGGSEVNTDAFLTGFFKSQGRVTLATYDMIKDAGKPREFLRVISQPDFVRYPDAHIDLHWVYDEKLLRISKSAFRTYLIEQDAQPTFVLDGLKKHYHMYEKDKVRLHAGLRTGGGGQERVLIIPIKPGTWLWDELEQMRPKPLKGEDHQTGLAVSPVEKA